MNQKRLMKVCLAVSLCLPVYSMAANLTIVNDTSSPSTSILNDGPCSTILGEAGVTPQGKTNNVSDALLKKGCISSRPSRKGQPWFCKADVYTSNNCTGNMIGKVYIDVNNGIQKVEMASYNPEHYAIWFDPENKFRVVLSGGPALQSWFKQTFRNLVGATESK